jgi:probable O-glycosylation ligase (exosortase A-associated)
VRDLLLSLLIPAGLLWGLFSAPGSIIVLNWIWFQRPYDFSMGMWNTAPLFMLALGIAILSNVLRGQFRLAFPPILVVFICLLIWITLSTMFAFDPGVAWQTYMRFLPSMWVAPILLFATIRDLNLLKWVFWVSAGGLGVNAFKTGASLMLQGGGHVTQQISGFVGDNNVFGLVLCFVVAILLGLRSTLPKHRVVHLLFFGSIAFVLMTIVFTKSRGAMASLAIILVLGSVLSRRPVRNLMALLVLAGVGYLAVPSEYFDRLNTIGELTEDESAMGRFENWELSWQEALQFPVLGVGPENHLTYNHAIAPDVQVRVAHSVYFQVLGELGFPGLFLYLLFVSIALRSLYGTWRMMVPAVVRYPDLTWIRDTGFWLLCGYVGYLFGSAFLNMFWIEFPWYAIFYGTMLRPLAEAELARRAKADSIGGGQESVTGSGIFSEGERYVIGR